MLSSMLFFIDVNTLISEGGGRGSIERCSLVAAMTTVRVYPP